MRITSACASTIIAASLCAGLVQIPTAQAAEAPASQTDTAATASPATNADTGAKPADPTAGDETAAGDDKAPAAEQATDTATEADDTAAAGETDAADAAETTPDTEPVTNPSPEDDQATPAEDAATTTAKQPENDTSAPTYTPGDFIRDYRPVNLVGDWYRAWKSYKLRENVRSAYRFGPTSRSEVRACWQRVIDNQSDYLVKIGNTWEWQNGSLEPCPRHEITFLDFLKASLISLLTAISSPLREYGLSAPIDVIGEPLSTTSSKQSGIR
ncbi:hypothetical protein ACFPVT_08150 [Corynebacterium choanae]|uniref:Uncharacterized protein n=1 Tax=Corynebacterium choanae TaxID=1862358 RepID=A0A3G6J7W7_9CORY|nr:hypothetical protein [Corynebacterium choanae]AZA14086.1 hypothetical protein CCHOA_08485 [Corynebacterium choanae]